MIKNAPTYFVIALYAFLASVGAFTGGIWAIGGIGGAIILFLATFILDKRIPRPDTRWFGLALMALAVMAAMNVLSSQPQASWKTWINLVTIFIPLSLLSSEAIQTRLPNARYMRWIPVAMAVGVIALGIELLLGAPLLKFFKGASVSPNEYNRSLSYIALLSFPIMAGLWAMRYRWITFALGILVVLPTGLTESRSAKLAFILGLVVTVAATYMPRLSRMALSGLPLVVLSWPFAAMWFFSNHYNLLERFPASWHHRMEIWDYMSYRLLERPLMGWGLGSSHSLPFAEPHGPLYQIVIVAASHPHNAVIQLWVELGIPGVVLGLCLAYLSLRQAARLGANLSPFALGAWVAALSLTLTAYNFWTDSLFAAFALVGFAFAWLNRSGDLFLAATLGDGVAGDNPHNAQKVA